MNDVSTPLTELYQTGEPLFLDVETTNLDKGDAGNPANRLLLACWLFRGRWYYSHGSEYEQSRLLGHIDECEFIVAHNAKFELSWLQRCGHIIGSKPVYCTMIAHYVLSGNRYWKLNLNAVAEYYDLGSKESLVDKFIKRGICPSELPRRWLLQYCWKDVELCSRIYSASLGLLRDDGLLRVFVSRCQATPVLADIECRGMHLDQGRVRELCDVKRREREEINQKLEDATGGINTNSSRQLAEFLYDVLEFRSPRSTTGKEIRTPAGERSCSKEAISRLRARTKEQRDFLELQKSSKEIESALTKYLEKMSDCCDENGGILKANFNQCRTATHRLSSTGKKYNIQLQNIGRNLKPLFSAREEGWYIAECDFSQLEFRVAVDLCDDIQGKEDIDNGTDIHAITASILFDEFKGARDEDRKRLRTAAKASTFRPLFGGSSGTAREKRYYKAFGERYKEITKTQAEWVDTVLRDKRLTLPSGLHLYYPDCRFTSTGYIEESTRIKNAPIQSFASAEIVLVSLRLLWERMQEMESFIISTVHDSIVMEVHPSEVEAVKHLCEEVMTKEVVTEIKEMYGYEIKVPLEVDYEYGRHWSEL